MRFAPEIMVEYLGSRGGLLAFGFYGSACLSCGLHDYFEDFAYILSESMEEEYYIVDVFPVDDGLAGWVVVYASKKGNRGRQTWTTHSKS